MKKIVIALRRVCCFPIYFYKLCLSPLIPHVCRFVPSCSTYFIQAVESFGIFKGSALGFKRLFQCTPNSKNSGYNPVPLNIKGDFKWLC